MDSDGERPPDDPLPEQTEPRPAQLHQPLHPPETEATVQRSTEQQEIDAEQRDTLAAVYAAHLDERAWLQDNREDLRNAQHCRRDQTADERDRVADQRDHAAAARDRAADERDRLANRREARADERELTALERHLQADLREATADQRELESEMDPRSDSTDSQLSTDTGET